MLYLLQVGVESVGRVNTMLALDDDERKPLLIQSKQEREVEEGDLGGKGDLKSGKFQRKGTGEEQRPIASYVRVTAASVPTSET